MSLTLRVRYDRHGCILLPIPETKFQLPCTTDIVAFGMGGAKDLLNKRRRGRKKLQLRIAELDY